MLRSRGSPRLRLLPLIFKSSSVFAAVRFLIISDFKVSRHQAEVAGFSATEAIATHNQKFPGRCRRLVFISIGFLTVRIIKLMSWDSLRLKPLPLIFKRSSALLPSSYYKKPDFFKKSWHQAEVGGPPRLMLLALIFKKLSPVFLSNLEWGFAERIRCLFKLVLVGPLTCLYLYSKS